jgi:hypothetical protein
VPERVVLVPVAAVPAHPPAAVDIHERKRTTLRLRLKSLTKKRTISRQSGWIDTKRRGRGMDIIKRNPTVRKKGLKRTHHPVDIQFGAQLMVSLPDSALSHPSGPCPSSLSCWSKCEESGPRVSGGSTHPPLGGYRCGGWALSRQNFKGRCAIPTSCVPTTAATAGEARTVSSVKRAASLKVRPTLFVIGLCSERYVHIVRERKDETV